MGAPDILSEPLFAPRRRSGAWSDEELAALDALYPKHGGVACVPLLNRSLSSIYFKARARGLKAPEGIARANFRKTVPAHVDAEIRAFYTRGGPAPRGEFQAFCARLGRTRAAVRDRALKMGLLVPRYKQLPWSAEEDAILAQHATLVPRRIQIKLKAEGYARTEAAIAIRMKRAEIDRTNYEGYSARALSALLGVDTKTVTRWIAAGLKAKHRGTARTAAQNGDEWIVEAKAFRAWARDNIAEFAKHSRKADQMWLLETLTGGTS